ncbi:MAG: SH3 domain-containing protein [Clostridiales bacterium]|nr:SH3 domain-containing protein [Clostridiales bacterium]
MKKNAKNSIGFIKLSVVMICAVLFFMGQKTVSLADSTGTVKENAKVRQSADTTGEVVGGLTAGTEVTIINEVTNASGTVWYEITSGNTRGFVRSDLINKSDTSATGTDTSAATTPATTTTSTPTITAAGAEEEPETALPQQYAKVTATAAKIRSKPSTSSGAVDSMPQNTPLIISGQTIGSDSRTWYYVVFKGTSGSEKSGYVRSDLIELGEMVPVEEPPAEENSEQEPETPVEEPVEIPDYEVTYEDPDGKGYGWYLHDNTGETHYRQNLVDLLTAYDALKHNAEIDESNISKLRVVIVILVAVIIIFAVVMTFMFFKLRDAYIGEDVDEDYNWKADRSSRDSNRESKVSKDREGRVSREGRESREGRSAGTSRSSADRSGEPVRRKSASHDEQQPVKKRPVDSEKKMPAREVSYEEDVTERPKPAPKKKAKNFLADDDDFEFEFLNMKDKDKD